MEHGKTKHITPYDELTEKIIAAAIEVHKTLGAGFEEVIYQRSLAKELPALGLDFSREVEMEITYKGEKVGKKRIDFIIENCMVEIKAKEKIEKVDFVQTLSYLKASGYKIGLLINFGGERIEVKRVMN